VAFWRNGMASVVLLPSLLRRRSRVQVRLLTRRERRLAFGAGGLLAAHFATWIPSLSYTSVASSVALVATQPVWAALIARARGQTVARLAWSGIAVALAGVVLLTGVDLHLSSRAVVGDGLALIGGLLAAAYVSVGAEVRQTVSTTVYTGVCYSTAAAVLVVTCLVGGERLAGYPPRGWLCLVAITVGPQLLGHSVFNRVLRTTSATVVSVAILFEIVGATLIAGWWFGEHPHAATVPAAVLIVAGVVAVVRAGTPAPTLEATGGSGA
jgi:drug/metabolite transporter (DMT)-like permease